MGWIILRWTVWDALPQGRRMELTQFPACEPTKWAVCRFGVHPLRDFLTVISGVERASIKRLALPTPSSYSWRFESRNYLVSFSAMVHRPGRAAHRRKARPSSSCVSQASSVPTHSFFSYSEYGHATLHSEAVGGVSLRAARFIVTAMRYT